MRTLVAILDFLSFQYLRETLPQPSDDVSFISNNRLIIWEPVARNDIAWNFEKFLISADGVPFQRYSRFYETKNIAEDIEKLLDVAGSQQDIGTLIGKFGGGQMSIRNGNK